MFFIMNKSFRMPLHRKDLFFFYAFNDAVFAVCGNSQGRGRILDGLVVIGIDGMRISEYIVQNGIFAECA